jgi:ethanolamine kinase
MQVAAAFALVSGAALWRARRLRDPEETLIAHMLSGAPAPLRLERSVAERDPAARHAGCVSVARELCPGWSDVEPGAIEVSTLQGGLTNQLYLLRAPSRPELGGVLVRLYGLNTEIIIDRKVEEIVFHLLSLKGFGPKLYGLFGNGRVEGFVPSEQVAPPDLSRRDKNVPQLIARELARMHELDMPLPREPHLWDFLRKFDRLTQGMALPEDPAAQARLDALDLAALRRRLDKLERELLPSQHNAHGRRLVADSEGEAERLAKQFLFEPVFCHNDALAGNVLLLPDRVQLIDFEYGKYNYRGFDFGNHFCEYAGFDFDLDKWYPDKHAQRYFLEHYIAAMRDGELRRQLKADKQLEDAFYEHCHEWCNRFAEAANFLWGLWALIQKMYSPIDFDYLDYARLRTSAIPKHL